MAMDGGICDGRRSMFVRSQHALAIKTPPAIDFSIAGAGLNRVCIIAIVRDFCYWETAMQAKRGVRVAWSDGVILARATGVCGRHQGQQQE